MRTVFPVLRAVSALLVLAGACAAAPVHAQWPTRPVTIIVPFSPGGNTDLMARLIAEPLTKALGQPVVVQNKPGAGGLIAADFVAKAPNDGYTLFMGTTGQISISRYTNKLKFDPIADFVPITTVGVNPFVITVSSKLLVKTLAQFIDYGKKHPNTLNVGNAGVGGITHLSGVMFIHRAGLDVTDVSYKGAALALGDVIGGQIDMYSGNLSEVLPYAKDARVRLLAVSSLIRVPQLPDVPTIAETISGHEVLAWNGLLGPAGMPSEPVDKIAAIVTQALATPAFAQRFQEVGITPLAETKAAFAARIQREMVTWKPLIEQAGIKPE